MVPLSQTVVCVLTLLLLCLSPLPCLSSQLSPFPLSLSVYLSLFYLCLHLSLSYSLSPLSYSLSVGIVTDCPASPLCPPSPAASMLLVIYLLGFVFVLCLDAFLTLLLWLACKALSLSAQWIPQHTRLAFSAFFCPKQRKHDAELERNQGLGLSHDIHMSTGLLYKSPGSLVLLFTPFFRKLLRIPRVPRDKDHKHTHAHAQHPSQRGATPSSLATSASLQQSIFPSASSSPSSVSLPVAYSSSNASISSSSSSPSSFSVSPSSTPPSSSPCSSSPSLFASCRAFFLAQTRHAGTLLALLFYLMCLVFYPYLALLLTMCYLGVILLASVFNTGLGARTNIT